MEVITLSEFAERCKSCDPADHPQEALALLQEAAKIALGADILKRKYTELGKKHAELEKKHAELKQNEADTKLQQAKEIISRAVELANKVISDDEKLKPKPKPEKKPKKEQAECKKYGEYKHVLLTDEQYQKLITDYGDKTAQDGIKKVDEYCQQFGKTYMDYNLTVRKYLRDDGIKSGKQPQQEQEHSYNLDVLMQHAMTTTPKIK